MTKPISLTVLDNGPLKIAGDELRVRYAGEAVAQGETEVYMCRCGESQNPPFCDGSHSKKGFIAEPGTGDAKDIHVWEGKTLRTFFNPNACMHVFYCKPLKELRKRELEGDAEAAAEIARVVSSCPSGALSFESTTIAPSAEDLAVNGECDIDVIEGGELRVQSAFEINAPLQKRQASDRATLCRCGLSKNKPWCDGRHKKRDGFR